MGGRGHGRGGVPTFEGSREGKSSGTQGFMHLSDSGVRNALLFIQKEKRAW